MDISTHINTLLKFHECIVIPEFGGFISNYKPSQFDSNRNLFTPPSKEIVFNSKINKNDGLLINHLVENERINYSEAHRVVENFVERSWSKLNKGETIEMKDLGNFKLNKSGSIVFTACTTFDLVEVYGLKEFNYQATSAVNTFSAYQPRPAVRAIQHRGNVIKIAASISLLLTLSLFPMKNDMLKIQTTTLNPISVIINSEPVIAEPVETVETISNQTITETIQVAPYILVGGNFQLLENANSYHAELLKQGHHPEIIHLENGNFRVTIDSFTDYQVALEAMATFRLNNSGSMAWVSKR